MRQFKFYRRNQENTPSNEHRVKQQHKAHGLTKQIKRLTD